MPEVSGEWQECFERIRKQLKEPFLITKVCRKASPNALLNEGCIPEWRLHWVTFPLAKNGNLRLKFPQRQHKIRKPLPSLHFCYDIHMVGLELGVSNKKALIQLEYSCWPCPCLYCMTTTYQSSDACRIAHHAAKLESLKSHNWFLEHHNDQTHLLYIHSPQIWIP